MYEVRESGAGERCGVRESGAENGKMGGAWVPSTARGRVKKILKVRRCRASKARSKRIQRPS